MTNESGFSILEALIAAVLLAVAILAFGVLSGNVMTRNDDSKRTTIATTLAQDKVEYIKNIALNWSLAGADGLDSPDHNGTSWSATTGGETVDSQGNTGTSDAYYTRTWTVDAVTGSFNLYDVTVTMSWVDDGTQNLEVVTRVSQ